MRNRYLATLVLVLGALSVKAVLSLEQHCTWSSIKANNSKHFLPFPSQVTSTVFVLIVLIVPAEQMWMFTKFEWSVSDTAHAQHQHLLIGYKKCAMCHNLPKHQGLITSRCNEFQVNMSSYAINSNKVTANAYSTIVNTRTKAGLSQCSVSSSSVERYLEDQEFLSELFLYVITLVHIQVWKSKNTQHFVIYDKKTALTSIKPP